jgi:hypothetical protein
VQAELDAGAVDDLLERARARRDGRDLQRELRVSDVRRRRRLVHALAGEPVGVDQAGGLAILSAVMKPTPCNSVSR